jgi:hypothetical protein
VKSAERAQERDFRGLRAIREEKGIARTILVCREKRPRLLDGVEVMPWEHFLQLLWSDRLLPR